MTAYETSTAEHFSAAGQDPRMTAAGSEYAQLSRAVRAAGLLRRRRGYYGIKISVNLLLLAGGWALFAMLGRSWWQLLIAVFLAAMFTQTGFIGHDAGHRQISGSKRADPAEPGPGASARVLREPRHRLPRNGASQLVRAGAAALARRGGSLPPELEY